MDEEQSTTKYRKTKVALTTLGAAVATIVAPPLLWSAYVYGKTTELAFKTTQTAFRHPWVTTGLLAGGILYAANSGDINTRIQEYASNAQQTVAEYRIDSLSEQVNGLEQKNKLLERTNKYLLTIPQNNNDNTPPPPALGQRLRQTATKDFYLGLATGAGGTFLGLAGYTYFRPRRHMRVVRR